MYLFSDGYASQFGGEKGKKFKLSSMKSLIVSLKNKSIKDQEHILNNTFEKWKGNKEQIDDVVIFAFQN